MGKPLILGVNWPYHWIGRPNVSYSMCNFYGATTTANGWFLRKPTILHETTKRHTLTPNLVEQIIWRMWQWRFFDTRERREKKYARIAIGNSMSSITLRRYRDVVTRTWEIEALAWTVFTWTWDTNVYENETKWVTTAKKTHREWIGTSNRKIEKIEKSRVGQ